MHVKVEKATDKDFMLDKTSTEEWKKNLDRGVSQNRYEHGDWKWEWAQIKTHAHGGPKNEYMILELKIKR